MVSYHLEPQYNSMHRDVLILVVVDNGLVLIKKISDRTERKVLILVVVDNGLVPLESCTLRSEDCGLNPCCSGQWSRTLIINLIIGELYYGLNPCCSGQWSRTQPYKTLLIINKLKNFTKQIFTFLNQKLTIS